MVYWETSEEKEDELIEKAYKFISKFEMEVPAVLLLETIKPLVFVGGGMLRIAASPFMMLFWKEGQSLIDTFEQRRNIEKLIKMLEDRAEKDKSEKDGGLEGEEETPEGEEPEKPAKKGWRRFLRF